MAASELKKGFIVYYDWAEDFFELEDAQAGQLIKAIFASECNMEYVIEDPVVTTALRPLKRQLAANAAAYEEKCRKNKANGSMGGRPRNPLKSVFDEYNRNEPKETENNRTVLFGFEEKPKKPDTDTDKDKGTATGKGTDTETDTETDTDESLKLRLKEEQAKRREQAKVQTARFEKFYAEYPNKKNKKTALERWLRMNPTEEKTEEIMKALREQKNSDEWKKDGGAFVPHPSTWLNQERWNDEMLHIPAKGAAKQNFKSETRDLHFLER